MGIIGEGLRHGYSYESPLSAAIHDASAGVAVLTCTVAPGGEVTIVEATRWDTTSDEDSAELRHWLTLRDALVVLGRTLPAVRAEVQSAIDAFDAACAPVQAARRLRDASYSEESQEALRQAEEEAAPAIAAAASASIVPTSAPPVVEMAPRRRF
jgi:hypothetical protein